MATFIVMMGSQGAGKGTQAMILAEKLSLLHVTSGGLFRAIKQKDTPLANQVRETLDRGDLMPDDITIQLVQERIQEPDAVNGVILDGFPRTLPQAEALGALLAEAGEQVCVVPSLSISDEVAIARLGARWMCSVDDNHIYNLNTNPPKEPGKCDIDGGALFQRKDDQPEAIRLRLDEYRQKTLPLLDYYRSQGVPVVEINAETSIEEIAATLLETVKAAC